MIVRFFSIQQGCQLKIKEVQFKKITKFQNVIKFHLLQNSVQDISIYLILSHSKLIKVCIQKFKKRTFRKSYPKIKCLIWKKGKLVLCVSPFLLFPSHVTHLSFNPSFLAAPLTYFFRLLSSPRGVFCFPTCTLNKLFDWLSSITWNDSQSMWLVCVFPVYQSCWIYPLTSTLFMNPFRTAVPDWNNQQRMASGSGSGLLYNSLVTEDSHFQSQKCLKTTLL